jgi:hypothetical protein
MCLWRLLQLELADNIIYPQRDETAFYPSQRARPAAALRGRTWNQNTRRKKRKQKHMRGFRACVVVVKTLMLCSKKGKLQREDFPRALELNR